MILIIKIFAIIYLFTILPGMHMKCSDLGLLWRGETDMGDIN